jgi:hypothetical protein
MQAPGWRLASFAFACLIALLLCVSGADARERTGRAHKGGAKSGQAHRTVTRTGPDGTARTSTHDSRWQRGDGKWTRDTVHTGPGGKQGTTHVEGAKTENGYTRQSTRTGPGGGVTTRNATGSYDPASKTWTHDATTTRPDGSTATSHGTRTRTEDGFQSTLTHTGPKGTTTVEGQGSWDPETKTFTREKLVTRPDGSTSKTEVTTQVTPDAPQAAPAE